MKNKNFRLSFISQKSSIVIGTVGFEYYNQYTQERELENLIVSCMEQFGHYSDKLVNCLNDNSLSNP